jgi:hypothetical protein
MPIVKIPNCGEGVIKDVLPSEVQPGIWSDASNVRFRNKSFRKRGGIQAAYTTPTFTPYFDCAYATPTKRFLVHAGIAKVSADDGTTQTEITRYTEGVAIASITRVGTTATLTTSSAHGRSTGHTVTVYGAFPADYNVTGAITVTGATTFTYTMLADPGSSATTVGQYSYNVQSDYTGAIDNRWTGGSFNGILVLNNGVDAPQYWGGDTTLRMRRFPGWPAGQTCDALVIFKEYLLALAPTISGVKYPHLILWCEATEPGAMPDEWTATSTNDAGDSPKAAETGGFMIDGKPWGDTLFCYKQDARFGVQWIGGNDVFRVFRVPGDDGLMARGCIANTPKGQVFLANGDIRIHSGGESISLAEGRIRDAFNADIDTTNAARAFLVPNYQHNEVWVCYPSYGSAACDKAWVWNWDSDTWAPFTVPNLTYATSGLVASGLSAGTWASDSEAWTTDATAWTENEYSQNEARLIVCTTAPHIGLAETGTTDFGTTVAWFTEKRGISLDDSDTMKVVTDSRWHFDAIAGTQVSVYHGTHKTADGEPSYTSAATHTQGTTNLVSRFSKAGRYMAVKVVGIGDQPIGAKSYDLSFNRVGRF